MPKYTIDSRTTMRDGTTALTATEAAGVNTTLVPPGEYWVDVAVPIVPTGTLPTLVVTFSEAADGSTWTAINPQVTYTASTTAKSDQSFRVRITKQATAGVTANFTAVCTVGGTTPSFGKVFIGISPAGPAAWNGQ